MIEAALQIDIWGDRPCLIPMKEMDVATWAIGRDVDEVMETLPRVFNLCRSAQMLGLNLALGRETVGLNEALRSEIIQDHRFKLHFQLPKLLDLPSPNLSEIPDLLDYQFAIIANAPQLLELTFDKTLLSGLTATRVFPEKDNFGLIDLIDVRIKELELLVEGFYPPVRQKNGYHIIPASRGEYWLKAQEQEGKINAFSRITPTDRMIAPDGLITNLLSSLHRPLERTLEIALAIIDPCYAVNFSKRAAYA